MIRQWRRLCITTLFVISSSVACGSAGPAKIQPQPDEFRFFERPLVLAAARKSDQPSPVLVLLENDSGAIFRAVNSPTFALYENGQIIQRTAAGFTTTRLVAGELEQFIEGLNIGALSTLSGHYQAEDPTDRDQPGLDLLIYRGEQPIFISVYGSLTNHEVRSRTPRAIVAAYDKVKAFRGSRSEEWLPDNIEIMVWRYEDTPDPSVQWPDGWPGLNDKNTIKRGEDTFSIFLPSAKLREVRTLLDSRSEQGAVDIGGKKWAASIRIPFPHEKLWIAPRLELENDKR